MIVWILPEEAHSIEKASWNVNSTACWDLERPGNVDLCTKQPIGKQVWSKSDFRRKNPICETSFSKRSVWSPAWSLGLPPTHPLEVFDLQHLHSFAFAQRPRCPAIWKNMQAWTLLFPLSWKSAWHAVWSGSYWKPVERKVWKTTFFKRLRHMRLSWIMAQQQNFCTQLLTLLPLSVMWLLKSQPINTFRTPKYQEFPTEKVKCVRAENCSYFKHIC